MKRLALLIALLLLPFGSIHAQTETPTLPYCATPGPTSTPVPTYEDKVLSYSPFVYWPLNEAAGTVAIDASDNGRHGTYSGVTLNSTTFVDGDRAPSFDGVNDYINVYSAINGTFSGSAGTISGWAKAPSEVWSDSATNRILNIQATSLMRLESNSATNNTLTYTWSNKTYALSTSTTDWFHWAITWDDATDTVVFYFNGSAVSTQTGLSAWSGSLNSGATVLGAANTGGVTPWSGNIAHVAMWTSALNGTQIADLYVVPAIAPTPSPTPICQVYNPTPTPTPDVYINFTTPGGADARIAREISIGDYALFFVVLSIPVSLWIMYGINRLKGGR
jgi:hypothetical protein